MAAKFRNLIAANTLNSLRTVQNEYREKEIRRIASGITLESKKSRRISFNLKTSVIPHFSKSELSQLIQTFPEDDSITGVATDGDNLKFYVDNRVFTDQVLKTAATRDQGYKWLRNPLFNEEAKDVLVEFSSPNIAKPFHIGHFRSTIIGNFVANIHRAVGHRVRTVNYLGDWGTQFGYLMAGMRHFDVDINNLKEDALNQLLDIYIRANKLAEENSSIADQARELFSRLEEGDKELLETWKYFREISVEQLKQIYARLNIEFDEYHGESMYSKERSEKVLKLLEDSNLLENIGGKRVTRISKDKTVTIVKSDGSSLYITRDIAAAIHRYEEFKFDKMIYVVDNAQASHFDNLFNILGKLGMPWASSCQHVRFGKILGMSTRKGNIVFLDTLMDEAKSRMLETAERSKTTRVYGVEGEIAARALGFSALTVNDFKHRRVKDYKFSWEQALNPSGETGVRLQYLHARLNSLLENCGTELDLNCSTECLLEQPASDLVAHIGLWDEAVKASYTDVEPSVIVRYLFKLSNLTNRCLKSLPVKGAEDSVSRGRLLMFFSAKQILADGLVLLGIQPLDRM